MALGVNVAALLIGIVVLAALAVVIVYVVVNSERAHREQRKANRTIIETLGKDDAA